MKVFIKIVYGRIMDKAEPEFVSLSQGASRYAIRYRPGVWMQPPLKGSKFFICENIKGAFAFMDTLANPYRPFIKTPFAGHVLWWCEAKGIERPQQVPAAMPSDDRIEAFWREYPYHSIDFPWLISIHGGWDEVLFANQVKLIHIVTLEEIQRFAGVKSNEDES